MGQAPMAGEGRACSGQGKLPSEAKALGMEVSVGEVRRRWHIRADPERPLEIGASEVLRERSVTGCVHRPCEVIEGEEGS